MPCSWFALNWLSVAIFASGNGFNACSSRAAFAGVSQPAISPNA